MAKERLSKLQKWIITECFKVTVLLDRSGLKKLKGLNNCHGCDIETRSSFITKKRDQYNCINYYCSNKNWNCNYFEFYRDDILLSYFNLEPDNWKYPFSRQQHFKGGPNNNKAHVTVHRSINNLCRQGYIHAYWCDGMHIYLLERGRETALKLLGMDSSVIVEPPLLSEEECEQKRKANEALIARLTAQLRRS